MERIAMHDDEMAQTWALSDGRAGNARQAGALAAALSSATREITLAPRAPWSWLAPRIAPGAGAAFGAAFDALCTMPPALAVGCGRQAALATRLLRDRCMRDRMRRLRTVQILDPRLDPRHWDLVVVPEHDRLRGPNVLTLVGSLHPVDDAWLAAARDAFAAFAALPRPVTALLVGGHSAHARFGRDAFEALASRLDAARARDRGTVLATASRRTPADVRAALRQRFGTGGDVAWVDEADGPNPYPGLLAWADRIVCTADSVNMVSEACATRAPVHVFEPQRVRGRPRAFLDSLMQGGRIRAMDATLATFPVTPLRETARIADEVRRRFAD